MIGGRVRILTLLGRLRTSHWSGLVNSGTVDIRIGDDVDQLRSLARWLQAEGEFRGQVGFSGGESNPGRMGGLADALTVIVTSGTATTLVSSVFGWLARTRESKIVSLKLRNADGRELELKCGSSDDAEQILSQVRPFYRDGV